MAAFQRPGARSGTAFGISFSADRESGPGSGTAAGAGVQQQQSAQRHREMSPSAKQQRQILYAIENHAVTILAADEAAGRSPGFMARVHCCLAQPMRLHALDCHTRHLSTGVAAHLLQSLHRAGWTAGQRQVACAHPQRIVAVNAAAAAAADIGASVGSSVGYSIAFEDIGTQVQPLRLTQLRSIQQGLHNRLELRRTAVLSSRSHSILSATCRASRACATARTRCWCARWQQTRCSAPTGPFWLLNDMTDAVQLCTGQ